MRGSKDHASVSTNLEPNCAVGQRGVHRARDYDHAPTGSLERRLPARELNLIHLAPHDPV